MLNIKIILVVIGYLTISQTIASYKDMSITNNLNKSIVIFNYDKINPVYNFLILHNPERIIVNLYNNQQIMEGFPINFNGKNLIKCVRVSPPINKYSSRIIFELINKSNVKFKTQKYDERYNIIITITKKQQINTILTSQVSSVKNHTITPYFYSKIKFFFTNLSKLAKFSTLIIKFLKENIKNNNPIIVVAIDPGHGGQDPGAVGLNGSYEKNVTIAIAKKLKKLLDEDPMFKPVLIRNGDYFISINERSNIARKKDANVLISIHADSTSNRNANGSSVWILSNKRVNNEIIYWSKQHDKQVELSRRGNYLLTNNSNQVDHYLNQALLDLQFGHSQRIGYDIAINVLKQLKNISTLHKNKPEYASFGVLRSPNIPSLLVETGFISNIREEKLLNSDSYQKKIANALYLGLRSYFLK